MFWLALRNADGDAVSCVGSRRFDTEDFINEWVTTWRLFGDETPHLEISTLDYVDTLPLFSGTVGYGGGLWVHPDFRGNDLAVQTSKLARVFTLRHFCADHYIVFVEGISEKIDWALNTLEWPNGANLSEGFYPGRGENLPVAIFWAGGADILEMCGQSPLSHQERLLKRTA